MALSQFIDPYSAEDAEKFISSQENIEQWKVDAYRFQPLSPQEIYNLAERDKEGMARYLRASCIRLMSNTQTKRSINRGNLIEMDFAFLTDSIVQSGMLERLQTRLLPSEQNIVLEDALGFLKIACDAKANLTYEPPPYLRSLSGPPFSEMYDEDYKERLLQKERLLDMDLRAGARYYLSVIEGLPHYENKEDLPRLAEVSFIRDREGRIIGEYSNTEVNKDRLVVRRNRRRLPEETIPLLLKKAIVSIEDERFWNFEPKESENYEGHKGVDFKGLMRAAHSTSSGSDVQGASTITMQLAKNLILYKEVFEEHNKGKRSLIRKLKEYILVRQLEDVLTKDEILEWYLNTIDFGRGGQGVVVAAQDYFNKKLSDLNLAEIAFLAGLPKSPNSLDPEENYEDALDRRNIVLKKMAQLKFISRDQRDEAKGLSIDFIKKPVRSEEQGYAQFYISGVENQMRKWLSSLGQSTKLGFDIKVPINYEYQKWAVEALQRGLLDYERKRKRFVVNPTEDQLPNIKENVEDLAKEKGLSKEEVFSEVLSKVNFPYVDAHQFLLGVVVSGTKLGLADGTLVNRQPEDRDGALFKSVEGSKKKLDLWDVVLLQPFPKRNGGSYYKIASFTKTQGAIIVVDNANGNVLATSGGFSIGRGLRYKGPLANRALTAFRQPGSTVKPFTYLLALKKGLSPSDIITNNNLTMPPIYDGSQRRCNTWSLSESYGASHYSFRKGLEKSKNKVTVNVFKTAMGVSPYSDPKDYADVLKYGLSELLGQFKDYGLYENLEKPCYPIMLGAEEILPIDIAGAYSTLARGGHYLSPKMISEVTRKGVVASPFESSSIDRAVLMAALSGTEQGKRQSYDLFRLRTMLQGVVANGTASSISKWSDVIAGKTGTTNSYKDAWFVGFNKEITVAVWVGRPDNRTLGSKAEGGSVALPIFKDFMENYYAKHPEKLENKFEDHLPGMVEALIEPNTGFLLTSRLQDDFKWFTGSGVQLQGVKEYFYSEAEKDARVDIYYPSSKVAGNFFFDSLTNQKRERYRSQYNSYVASVGGSSDLAAYEKAYRENDAYCREWVGKGYATHPEVKEACRLAEVYGQEVNRLRQSARPTITFREYFLQVNGFNN